MNTIPPRSIGAVSLFFEGNGSNSQWKVIFMMNTGPDETPNPETLTLNAEA